MKKYIDIDMLQKQICGALRETIEQHGPINKQWISSAAKRIAKQIAGRLEDMGGRGVWEKSKKSI